MKRTREDSTPRELKLYVNQIGVIHRQWQHQFPLDHIAYYVALCRKCADIPKISSTRQVPDVAAGRNPNAKLHR